MFVGEQREWDLRTPKSENAAACVKTRVRTECAELFSPFSSFNCDGQCCSFPIQRNRDEISTRKFDVGVFTQAGPEGDIAVRKSVRQRREEPKVFLRRSANCVTVRGGQGRTEARHTIDFR